MQDVDGYDAEPAKGKFCSVAAITHEILCMSYDIERELGLDTFDDGRGRLPDRIKVPVPVGFRDAVKAAAAAEGLAAAEFIRRAIANSVLAVRSKEQAAA